MALKIFNTLFLAVFVLSALAQINDPDPAPWLAMYLTAAIMCVAHYRATPGPWLPLTLLAGSLVWILFLLPDVVGSVPPADIVASLSMRSRAVEEAREIGGLTLIAFWAGFLALRRQT